MTTRQISNTDDVIDSRDVIARIDELESEIADAEISEDNGATPQLDDNGKTRVEMATCGECSKSWNDALISGSTPAPSGRCPYEHIHEEIAELKTLQALADECDGCGDWQYGETLIRDSYFQRYAEELADDCGMVDEKVSSRWPYTCIDWERAAEELQQDYTSVEYGDVTYWIRS